MPDPKFNMHVPMSSPDITDAEREAVLGVLDTPILSMGTQLGAFERALAEYVGAPHAVAVNSGTSGLHLCVIGAGVAEGDFVITSPFSFIASANCLLYERAIPIFVDVDARTGNLDTQQVEQAVQDLTHPTRAGYARWLPPALRDTNVEGVRLKAILPVHTFGQPADMAPLLRIAAENDLRVIEDACEAIGAEYLGRPAGTMGDAAVFAFYPNKQMTTGEGGMIVTRHAEWAELFRSLRNQGRGTRSEWLDHQRLGYNYRLDEMSAALGLVQVQRLDELLTKRERVMQWYRERLAGAELIELPQVAPNVTRMSWFLFVVRIKPPADRDWVMGKMAEHEIPTRLYFSPIHLQKLYRSLFGYTRGDLPVSEALGDVSLALPFSSVMTEEQVDFIAATLQDMVQCSATQGAGGELR